MGSEMCIRDRLRRVRDFAEVKHDGHISEPIADEALNLLAVDKEGLDGMDRRLISTIVENFSGGPVGLDALAASISEERGTIEDVIEPYLIQQGYLVRTPRGRAVTDKTYRHLGLGSTKELEQSSLNFVESETKES